MHARKLYLLQEPQSLSLLKDGGDRVARPLDLHSGAGGQELLSVESSAYAPVWRSHIVYRDAQSLAVLRRQVLAEPTPTLTGRYAHAVLVADLGVAATPTLLEFDGELTAHDLETGALRWQQPRPGGTHSQSVAVVEGPCAGDGCGMVALSEAINASDQWEARVVLRDGDSGAEVWSQVNPLCPPGGCAWSATAYTDLNGDLVPDIVHASDNHLRALDGATRQQLWRVNGLPAVIRAIRRSPDARRRLLTIDDQGVMRNHDPATGAILRERRYPSERVCEPTWCGVTHVRVSDTLGYWVVHNGNPFLHWVRDDLRAASVQPLDGADYVLAAGTGALIAGGEFGMVRSQFATDDLFVDDFEGR